MTLKILSSLAVERALTQHLLPRFTEAEGEAPDVEWNPTKVMVQRIADGARGDLTILIDDYFPDLIADGVIQSETVTPIAIAGMGFAVAPGTPHPDLSDAAAVKEALLNARSVAYSRTGASGVYFALMIERLGIADQVNAKATIIPEGFTAREIVAGRADMAIQQISELMTVDGIEIAGPLPPELQQETRFSAALFAGVRNPAADRCMAFLTSQEAHDAYLAGGLSSRLPF